MTGSARCHNHFNKERVCVTHEHMSIVGDVLFTSVAILFASFGAGIFKFGRMLTVPVRAMEAEKPTPIGELTPGEPAEISGTVQPAEEGTLETAVYGHEAVEFTTAVQRQTDKSGSRGGWYTYHEEHESLPFLVTDGTGEVRVDPPGNVDPNVETEWVQFGAGVDEPLPDPVHNYLSRLDEANLDAGIDIGPLSMGSRQRCGEASIEPGDEIHVYGSVTEPEHGWDAPDVTLTSEGDTPFVYSTIDPEVVQEATTRLGLVVSGFGLLWMVVVLVSGLMPWILRLT